MEAPKFKSSVALWIPIFWYLIFASRPLGRWLSSYDQNIYGGVNALEGSPVDRVVLSVLILAGILVLLKRLKGCWGFVLKDNRWVVALLMFMLLSMFWSSFPLITFKRLIKAAGALVMVMVVLSEEDPVEAVVALFSRAFLLLLPLSLILIKYFRKIGVAWSKDGLSAMWVGVTTHKNVLGQICMTAAIFYIWMIFVKKDYARIRYQLPLLFLSIYLMNGPGYSKSTTSMLILFVGVCIIVATGAIKTKPEKLNRLIVCWFLGLLAIGVVIHLGSSGLIGESAYSLTVNALGRDESLTGRTDLWVDVARIGMKTPIFGVGYGGFWVADLGHNLWTKYTWHPGQAHNGYVDVFIQLGVVGLVMIAGIVVTTIRKYKNRFIRDFTFAQLTFAYFVMIVIHNVSESSFLRGSHNLWFLFLLVVVQIDRCSAKNVQN